MMIKRLLSLFITLFMMNDAFAFKDSRDEKWQIYLVPAFTNSKLLKFDNGAEADINEQSGFAFGIGYNVDLNLELGVEFGTSNGNYAGTRILDDGNGTAERFSANLYTSRINFQATYNLLTSPMTPFISVNIGSTFIDSGIPTGNIGSACWWDPWWGYICTPTAQTYTATKMNYGAGAGLRYDFNRKVYVKAGVYQNIVDIDSSNTADFTTYQFAFGFMF